MIFPILNILSNCKLISYFTGIPNIPILKQSETSDEKCGYVSVEGVTVLAWSALPVLACCSPRRETWQTFCIMRCYFATSWFYLWYCRYCWGERRRRGGYWNVGDTPRHTPDRFVRIINWGFYFVQEIYLHGSSMLLIYFHFDNHHLCGFGEFIRFWK